MVIMVIIIIIIMSTIGSFIKRLKEILKKIDGSKVAQRRERLY